MNPLAKRLRADTGYPWQDCLEAARRTDDYAWAREMLPVIYRERKGIAHREEMTQVEIVQAAVVESINTLGATLIGSSFTPVTSSPIPDDEVAQILAKMAG